MSEDPKQPMTWKSLIERFRRIVPVVSGRLGTGSGLILPGGRAVLTNRHVVAGSDHVGVMCVDGTFRAGVVVDRCADEDLAIIFLANELPVSELCALAPANAEAGDEILAIGHPRGFNFTATRGIVSASDRRFQGDKGTAGLIQVDVKIDSGSSGGPVIDSQGRLVGISVAFARQTANVGFIIPADAVTRYCESRAAMIQDFVNAVDAEVGGSFTDEVPSPDPWEAVCLALDGALELDSDEIEPQVSEEDGETLRSWEVELGDGDKLIIRMLDPESVESPGYCCIYFAVCTLSPEQFSDVALLRDLLRSNWSSSTIRVAIDDDRTIYLVGIRHAYGLGVSEASSMIVDLLRTRSASKAAIERLRSGDGEARPMSSLFSRTVRTDAE